MYYVKTKHEKSQIRIRPLAGQKFPSGKEINPDWNVIITSSIKTMYGLGSFFVVEDLVEGINYYTSKGEVKACVSDATPEHKCTIKQMEGLELLLGGTEKPKPIAVPPVSKKVTYLDKLVSNKNFSPPTIEDNGFFVNTDLWYLLLRNIKEQHNTLLLGPTGTGKTELVSLLCKKLAIPYAWYDMGAMIDPIPNLLGTHRLVNGKSVFDYAKFTDDIQNPGVILLDELSRPSPLTTNILLPCLDSRRTLPVEIAGGKDTRSIAIHENCSFVATANIGAQYTGTTTMDRALTGRFFPIEMDYMDADKEISVLCKRTDISKDEAIKIIACANNIRKQYKLMELSDSISTRETIMAAKMVFDGFSVLKALESCYLPLFEGTKDSGERGIVTKIIMSR